MMKVSSKTVCNNVEMHIINTNKFKFVNMQLCFTFPLDYADIAAYNLLLNIMITRNNKYKGIDEFNTYLENNYGMTMNGSFFNRGNVAIFSLYSSSMNSKFSMGENLLEKQMQTMHDCLYDPYLNEESLSEIKQVYIEKLKDKLNKKTYILKKKINEMFSNDNPYGVNIESDIESIESVNLDKIKEVYQKLLNSDTSFYVCGDVDENELTSYLSNFDLKNDNNFDLDLSYLKDIDNRGKQEYESSFLQSAISLIYQCDIKYNDKLFYPLKVFLEMFNYDLFNIIREKYNYCYYIYALSNNYLNTIEIVSEIESKNLDSLISLVDEILKSYQDSFDSNKFLLAKNKMISYIENAKDNPKDLLDLEFSFYFTKMGFDIDTLKRKYEEVSEEEVKDVSKLLSLKIVSILKEDSNNE